MMKRILIALGTVFLTAGAFAQSRSDAAAGGLSLGVNAGWLYDTPVVNTQYAYTRAYSSGSGAILAMDVRYIFNDWLSVIAEPGLQCRNTSYRLSNWYDEKSTSLYTDIPVMAGFSFGGKKLRGFVNTGAYAGWWTCRWDDKEANSNSVLGQSSSEQFNEFGDDEDRFDAGLLAGIGLQWFTGRKVSLSLEYRFWYGLTSRRSTHADGSSYGHYDNLQTITLGVHFNNFIKK